VNIHVGNLSPHTSLSTLRGWFEVFGRVTDVTISTFRIHGEMKAQGFVDMPSGTHAQAAIAGLEGKELGGTQLSVRKD
jgi:RNA recognition motif-containing protein